MFGLLKLGAIPVAIDPGMGVRSFLRCVRHTEPEALVGVRAAVWLSRTPLPAFRSLRARVQVGTTKWRLLREQCASAEPRPLAEVSPDSPAAILFTSGSTGAPKGVDYTHGMFDAQIELIRRTYAIQPGEVDMPMLPLFALFNPALRSQKPINLTAHWMSCAQSKRLQPTCLIKISTTQHSELIPRLRPAWI